MEVLKILEQLEELIETSKGSVFGNKVNIDKEELMELITDIRISLPDDMKQAEWVSTERQRIIFDAQEESESIINEAKIKAEALCEENHITQMAYKKADTIVAEAEEDARELRNGAIHYSQQVLKKISENLNETSKMIMVNHKELGKMIEEAEDKEIEQ